MSYAKKEKVDLNKINLHELITGKSIAEQIIGLKTMEDEKLCDGICYPEDTPGKWCEDCKYKKCHIWKK